MRAFLFAAVFAFALGQPLHAAGASLEAGERSYKSRNYPAAYRELLPLAEAGNPRAQFLISEMYYFGRSGFPKDWDKTFAWLQRAAQQGYLPAVTNLGFKYIQGRGVRQDKARGIALVRRAALAGRVESQQAMGIFYYIGYMDAAEQDIDEAEKWFRMGAEQGDKKAFWRLGEIYAGENSPRDDEVEAMKWLILAGRDDYYMARRLYEQLTLELSPEQMAEAERRANTWLAERGK